MSRIGKKPIDIPGGVTVEINANMVSVKGPLGADSCEVHKGINITIDNNIMVLVNSDPESDTLRAMHGLYRSLLANIVTGVSAGFEKELEIQGVGYRAQQQGADIQLHLGYSHPVIFTAPEGITLTVVDPTHIKIKGSNKQKVGEVSAKIRKLRAPEPYKGKGIRYKNENVRRKAGKSGKK